MALEDMKLNGVTAAQVLDELKASYFPVLEGEGRHDPNQDRQDRITPIADDIGNRVNELIKGMTKDPKSSKDLAIARSVIKELAYKLAKDKGYSKPLDDFGDEDVRRVLGEVAATTGNPIYGNETRLIESIVNLMAAKSGAPKYNSRTDAEAPLGTFINYVATQLEPGDKDKKIPSSAKISYDRTLLAEGWEKPGIALELQEGFGKRLGIELGKTASATDAFERLQAKAAAQSQMYAATAPKTYTK